MPEDIIKILREHFYIPLYFITWLISVLRYKRFFDTPLQYLPMLIIYTFFTELLGYFIKFSDEYQFFSDERYNWHNVVIFNIYQMVFFLFFLRVYQKTLKDPGTKKWVSWGSIACILIYLANSLWQNPLHEQLSYAHILVSIMLVVVLVLYFREKHREENPISLKYNLMFWVSMGLLIFYSIFPLILIAYKIDLKLGTYIYLRPILICLIVSMYACIITGLLVGKRKAFR